MGVTFADPTTIIAEATLKYEGQLDCDFEDLLENAGLCDATGSLNNALIDGSVWGILYKTMIAVETPAPAQDEQQENVPG